MKKLLTVVLGILFSCMALQAQRFVLTGPDGMLSNGDTLTVTGPPDTLQLITWLRIDNTSAETLRIRMKKQEVAMLPGTVSSICWAGYCYGPDMTESTFPLVLEPEQSDTGCFTHYGPNLQRGTSVVRWTWFSEADPADSILVTVFYATYPTGVAEAGQSLPALSFAGRIPADLILPVHYSLPQGVRARLEVINNHGNTLFRAEGLSGEGRTDVEVAAWPAGHYTCVLTALPGRTVTRKVVIIH